MGGLVGGIFDLFGGNPTAGEQQGEGSLANYENNTGEGATNAGLGFENAILSGNPEAIAQVEAPEIRAGQDQIQQQAEQNAFFGNRGGGTNSSTNAAQSNERGDIINLTGQLQQGAAQTEIGAGENLLGQGSTNLMNEAQLAEQNRERQVGDINGIAQGAASIATEFMDPAAAASPSLGNIANPEIANYLGNNGPAPTNYIDTSGLEGSPDLSIFQ